MSGAALASEAFDVQCLHSKLIKVGFTGHKIAEFEPTKIQIMHHKTNVAYDCVQVRNVQYIRQAGAPTKLPRPPVPRRQKLSLTQGLSREDTRLWQQYEGTLRRRAKSHDRACGREKISKARERTGTGGSHDVTRYRHRSKRHSEAAFSLCVLLSTGTSQPFYTALVCYEVGFKHDNAAGNSEGRVAYDNAGGARRS